MVTAISCVAVLAFAILGVSAVPKPSINGRIVGGDLTDISVLPYQVSLQVEKNGFYRHICGGSIIDAKYVVTAAHCTQGVKNRQIRVGSSVRSEGGRVYHVKRVINHDLYDREVTDYDISLLELAEPIAFNDKTSVIELVEEDDSVEADEEAVVSGWGNTKNYLDDASLLRSATVPIFDQRLCTILNQEYNPVTDRMICAGYLEGGKDSCQGDSGGPLTVDGKLVGIVSWGVGCAQPNYPAVYTRVSFFREWIRENSGV